MKQKVLIVDDSYTSLLVLEKVLQKLPNVEIMKARSGRDAYQLAIENDFSLAIIDICMPDMDGIELANLLYNNKKTDQLSMIFISAVYPDQLQLSRYGDAIAVDFILKPINKELLYCKVKSILKLDSHARNLDMIVKERTKDLNSALQEWHITLDAISDYVCIMDREGTILLANSAMLNSYGNDIIGKKCCTIFHPDQAQKVNCPVSMMLDSGETQHVTIHDKGVSGDKYLDVSVFPIKDESGYIFKYVHIVRDITKRVEVDQQLRHGEKMLAIGQLAGGIAHDFNNQLTAILGYATLLKSKVEDNETLKKYAKIIIDSTKRSSELTQKLLAFSRKGGYQKANNNIHQLIKEDVILVDRTINKKINIDLQFNAVKSTVYCDASQMSNAFLNLIINAKDAMPDGGTITISTRNIIIDKILNTTENNGLFIGEYIEIQIADTGTGITADVMEHIFEPFFSTKDEKGTGLGLAAVYGTVTNSKGTIDVTSVEGEGALFTIKLPVVTIGEDVGEDTEFAIEDAKAANKSSALILLVDDEEMVRDYAQDVMNALDYKVVSCCDGKEALEIYRKRWREIDVVVMDVIMPVMGGKEAYYKMREINPEIKTIFFSGYSEDNMRDVLNNSNTWLINKPFEVKTMSDILKTVLT
jgi:PAS domain S-box-containing protein